MRTSFHHQSEAQPPNGPLTAATSPDTPSLSHSRVCASTAGLAEAIFAEAGFTNSSARIAFADSAIESQFLTTPGALSIPEPWSQTFPPTG